MLSIKDISLSILKKSEFASWPVGITGFSAAILQCIIVREFLSVFFGNELILGIVFGVWLLSAGIGSFTGHILKRLNGIIFTVALSLAACLSFCGIRFFPTLFPPGSVAPIRAIAMLFVLVETPLSFLTGYIFGYCAGRANNTQAIYGFENSGILAGTLVVFVATLMNTSNAVLLIFACAPLPLIILGNKQHKQIFAATIVWICTGAACSVILQTDARTAAWKYAGEITGMHYTREGELTTLCHGNDTTVMLNNMVYRSTVTVSMVEQAVHIPAAQRAEHKHALILFDRGHRKELEKYPGLHCDVLETLPDIAGPGSIVTSPERYQNDTRYDLLFIGASVPNTAATSRFYTIAFFRRMKTLLSPSAVLSFTVPYNENFMPKNERILHDILRNTLHAVFPFVLVFPGNGYATFMASDDTLHIPDRIKVRTEYLAPYIIPALSIDKIRAVNGSIETRLTNTTARPIALYVSLSTWMQEYGFSATLLFSILGAVFVLGVVTLPRTAEVVSIATSGLSVGFYSVVLMLLYQAVYGDLYAEIALLLMTLSLGFITGSRVRRLPWSDTIIGCYLFGSFLLLTTIQYPPVWFFLFAHFGIGFLSAAQFVTRKNVSPGILNSADLFGGVFGMTLSSTVLVPLFGILPVAGGVFALKIAVGLFGLQRNS